MDSEFSKFHPNPFTTGGVIAERVNIVQTRHKVFAILGEASASSPSNNIPTIWRRFQLMPSSDRAKVRHSSISHRLQTTGCNCTNLGRRLDWQRTSSERSGRRVWSSPMWNEWREMNRMKWLFPGHQSSTCRAAMYWRWSRHTTSRYRKDNLLPVPPIIPGM